MRTERDDGWIPVAAEPRPRRGFGAGLIVGCGLAIAIPAVLAIIAVVLLGFLAGRGTIPGTAAVPGDELLESTVEFLLVG